MRTINLFAHDDDGYMLTMYSQDKDKIAISKGDDSYTTTLAELFDFLKSREICDNADDFVTGEVNHDDN